MTAERWRQIREVLYAAAEKEAGARAEFLRESCGGEAGLRAEVERLLAALDESGGFLEPAAPRERDLGGKIGPYLILDRAGQGGMGTVYRAVREDDYRQEVAIKLVKREVETAVLTARFRQERQALARLNHPNIARLLDGGTTADGRPYLVLEWVAGESITEYANERKLGVRERLGLFVTVCDAVAHAHRLLVVHRDIKPSNLLITADGVPKLLDFGIAKILEPDAGGEAAAMTVAGGGALTPDYASPEQVRGEPLTTATDVYSLGATLYELLTGVPPHRFETRTPPEIERVVCEREVTAPSAVGQAPGIPAAVLRGDLDNIVRKAMEKEQGRRYSHVEEFAGDVRRYLEGRPVLARPGSVGYRVRKFAARNKVLVGAGAAVAIALAAGLGLALWQAGVARQQRALAERRFELARRVADSLLYEINDRIQDLAGSTAARELLLRRSLEYLDALARESGSNAALQRDVANAYIRAAMLQGDPGVSNLGNPAAARESLRKAQALLESALGNAPGSVEIRRDLARAHREAAVVGRDRTEFARHAQAALGLMETVYRERTRDAAVLDDLERSEFTMARSLAAQERYPEAAVYYRRALGHAGGSAPQNVALDHKSLGAVLVKTGDPDEALKEYEAATAIDEGRVRANPADGRAKLDLSYDYADTGLILLQSRRAAEGVEMYRKAQGLRAEMVAADPRDARAASALVSAEWRLGYALSVAGDRAHAAEAFRLAVAGAEGMIARLPDKTVGTRALADAAWNIGETYRRDWGACALAVPWLTRARGLFRELKEPTPRVDASLAVCGAK